MLKLISMHIPKTGGHSFGAVLHGQYGRDGVVRINIHRGNRRQVLKRKRTIRIKPKGGPAEYHCNLNALKDVIPPLTRVLHGHFRYRDICHLSGVGRIPLITWVRDPVERVISNYFYHLRQIRSGHREDRHGMGKTSLIQYASMRMTQNRMHRFVKGLSLHKYFFIGVTEHFEEDLNELANILGWATPIRLERRNTTAQIRAEHEPITDKEKAIIRGLNRKDIRIYQEVLRLRATRRSEKMIPRK